MSSIELVPLYLMATFTILFNAPIIALYLRKHTARRKPTATLFCSQAFADILTGSVLIPVVAVDPNETCKVTPYLLCFVFFAGLISKSLLAYDKYLAITRPLHYRVLICGEKVQLMLLLSWGGAVLLTLMPVCWQFTTGTRRESITSGFVLFLALSILVGTVGTIFMYMVTYLRVISYFKRKVLIAQSSQRNEMLTKTTNSLVRKRRQASLQFLVMSALLALNYIPIMCINVAEQMRNERTLASEQILAICLYIFCMCALINPLVSLWNFRDLKVSTSNSLHRVILRCMNTRVSATRQTLERRK